MSLASTVSLTDGTTSRDVEKVNQDNYGSTWHLRLGDGNEVQMSLVRRKISSGAPAGSDRHSIRVDHTEYTTEGDTVVSGAFVSIDVPKGNASDEAKWALKALADYIDTNVDAIIAGSV